MLKFIKEYDKNKDFQQIPFLNASTEDFCDREIQKNSNFDLKTAEKIYSALRLTLNTLSKWVSEEYRNGNFEKASIYLARGNFYIDFSWFFNKYSKNEYVLKQTEVKKLSAFFYSEIVAVETNLIKV